MAYWIVNGNQLTDKEYEEYQRQQLEEQEQIRQQAEALVQKLGQTYDELTRLLEQNPEVGRQVTERTAKDDHPSKPKAPLPGTPDDHPSKPKAGLPGTPEEVYRRLRQRLELADAAPRCRWIKQDGTACGSPQMRKHIYCFAHKQMMEARALALRLPALEDANAIQIGLMRIQKALIEDTITTKKAGLLLYSMQLALTNVGQTTFGQSKDEELVRDTVDEVEALGDEQSACSQDRVTAEDTEENRDIPLINADERGLNRTGAGRMVIAPILTADFGLPTIGQTHANLG